MEILLMLASLTAVAFLGALLTSTTLGGLGVVPALLLLAIMVVLRYRARRRPARRGMAEMSGFFVVLGVAGLASVGWAVAKAVNDQPLMPPAALGLFGLAMAFILAAGVVGSAARPQQRKV
jgi:uncharacterized membrane protein YqjE